MEPEIMSLMSKGSKSKKEDDLRSDAQSRLDIGTTVCCCECMCTNKKLEGMTCCCCCPIACGVYFIALFIIFLTIFGFTEIFLMLLDDDIAWWYVFIACILLIPAVVASAFAVRFIMVNNQSRRT